MLGGENKLCWNVVILRLVKKAWTMTPSSSSSSETSSLESIISYSTMTVSQKETTALHANCLQSVVIRTAHRDLPDLVDQDLPVNGPHGHVFSVHGQYHGLTHNCGKSPSPRILSYKGILQSNRDPNTRRHNHFKGLKVINFRFTNKVLQNEVDEAILNLHIQELEPRHNVTITDDHFTINLQVNRVTRNSQGNKASVPYTESSIKLTKKELKVGKWLKVNVTNMVAEFFRLPRDNLAIVVRVQDSKNRLSLVVPHPSSESNNALMPYIEVSLRDNSHKRTRRTIGMDCTENTKEVRCCRYPLSVNFEEFGWDWIIAPKQYDANYCSGECPYSFLQKYPHTHLVHLAAPQGSGGPCCAPRRMSSISMLYFDHDFNIIYGTIPGMVVESCGCS